MRGKKRTLHTETGNIKPADIIERRPKWQEIDDRLRSCARGAVGAFLEFAVVVRDAYQEKVWERFGYQDPEPYFLERIGFAPRTFRRYLRINNMLALLPPTERENATEKVARIGPNKAEVIAAIVETAPGQFDDWVEKASEIPREALEEQVKQALGLRPHGGPHDGGAAGEQFGRYILNVFLQIAASRSNGSSTRCRR